MKRERDRFPAALRSARSAQRLTQHALAERIGVSQSSISLWESGYEQPTIEHIILLALELPELVQALQGPQRALLERILRLERTIFAGKCACPGCNCATRAVGGS